MARSHLEFLGAWSKPLPGVSDPFVAELLALREGVIFAHLRGYSHVIMEVDCMELVNLWNSRRNSRSIAAPILNELEDIVPSFSSVFGSSYWQGAKLSGSPLCSACLYA